MGRSPKESAGADNPTRHSPDQQRQREQQRQDDLLDEALEETFPASDPIAPATPRERQSS